MFIPGNTFLTMIAASAPAEPQDHNAALDYALGAGVLLLAMLLPHFIAAKILAGEKATGLWVLSASVLQFVFGALLFIANIMLIFMSGVVFSIGGPLSFILLSLVIAGIYGFGFWRGALYNIITAAAFIGIALLLGFVLSYGPVRRILPFTSGAGTGLGEGAQGKPIEIEAKSRFATDKEAQAAAVQKYPSLGVAGSSFNKRFLEIHARYKKENPELLGKPDWPMVIAEEVAAQGVR